ncbi:Serine/threonine-protein kinase STN8 [Forsythia ovata]|uniref:Serine/threonine-protein kinase STN8 n=1 Tax=Forsythia ovata TaxID=205694 RepID=A0ABD1SHX2_9LAMI
MASLLSPTATTFHQDSKPIFFSPSREPKPISQGVFWSSWRKNSIKCNAFLDDISENLLNKAFELDRSLSQIPAFQEFQRVTGEFPEGQKWGILVFAGFTWIYLTARPGVLIGAIDAYILAPLQVGFDSLSGRRSLKRTDFLIGDKLGEGSFGSCLFWSDCSQECKFE